MKKIAIIGHRGAAGLELENTETSIKRAMSLQVSAIEVDIRLTKDNVPVLLHDSDLLRVANDSRKVRNLTHKQLQKVSLNDGSSIPSLHNTLHIVGDTHIVIELKDSGSIQPVIEVLKSYPRANVSIASFNLQELTLARSLSQDLFLYGLERTKPFDCIHLARILNFNGVGLNYWLLNPLTYWYAHRSGLKIYVYTVNRKFLAKFLSRLYPKVAICTDHPEWFVTKRSAAKKPRRKKGVPHAR